MLKKSLIIIIISVTVSLLIAFGGVWFVLKNKSQATEENVVEEKNSEIDYKKAKTFSIEDITVKLKQTASKPSYLVTKIVIVVKDEKALAEVEGLADIIKDSILSVLETKTAEELEGSRNAIKEPLLEAIRNIFPAQEDKDKIVAISIPEFLVQ